MGNNDIYYFSSTFYPLPTILIYWSKLTIQYSSTIGNFETAKKDTFSNVIKVLETDLKFESRFIWPDPVSLSKYIRGNWDHENSLLACTRETGWNPGSPNNDWILCGCTIHTKCPHEAKKKALKKKL